MTLASRSVFLALAAALTTCAVIATPYATRALAMPGADAIFAIGEGGFLDPIAVRRNGKFVNSGSNDGGPSQRLANASIAALASAGNRVHVLFGGRVIATAQATIDHMQARIAVPSSLHLTGHVSALASTLGGYAKSARRAPTARERRLALTAAASRLNTTAERLTVRNLTAIDLGRGIAFVGSVDLRGTGTPRTDKRLFFVLDATYGGGGFVEALANVQTIKVTEALLEEPAEYLVDAVDLGNDTPALVTSIIGYDANTYAMYARAKSGPRWTKIYEGGGAAM